MVCDEKLTNNNFCGVLKYLPLTYAYKPGAHKSFFFTGGSVSNNFP